MRDRHQEKSVSWASDLSKNVIIGDSTLSFLGHTTKEKARKRCCLVPYLSVVVSNK